MFPLVFQQSLPIPTFGISNHMPAVKSMHLKLNKCVPLYASTNFQCSKLKQHPYYIPTVSKMPTKRIIKIYDVSWQALEIFIVYRQFGTYCLTCQQNIPMPMLGISNRTLKDSKRHTIGYLIVALFNVSYANKIYQYQLLEFKITRSETHSPYDLNSIPSTN